MDLDAIEAAEKAMTPVPWSSDVSRPGISAARCPREAVLSEQGYPPTLVCRTPACDGPKRLAERAANLDGIALLRNSAPAIIARIREQDAEIERLKCACSNQDDAICQTLGQALGYPRYCDDPKNFPGATEANGVCVGDHVAESLADEAAREIRQLREALEAVVSDLARVRDHEYEEPFVTAGTMVKVYATLESKGGERD